MTPDLLNDKCDSLTGWTSSGDDGGTAEVSPAGQFHLAGNGSGAASRGTITKASTIPTNFTQEALIYLDSQGTGENTGLHWQCNNGTKDTYITMWNGKLFYYNGSTYVEIGTNLAPTGSWITWRLQSTGASCEVFKNGVSVGTVTMGNGSDAARKPFFQCRGYNPTAASFHIDYIKIGTGIGSFDEGGSFLLNFI